MTKFTLVFLATFFLSIHSGIVIFSNSSLLRGFFESSTVSSLFFLGAVGSTALLLFTPRFIEYFGKRFLLTFFLFLALLSVLGMVLGSSPTIVAVFFLIYASVQYIIYYHIDIFLEELSKDANTSEIRGGQIALVHLGFIIGLLLLSILSGAGFRLAFITSAFFLIPPIFLTIFVFKSDFPHWHGLHRHHLLPYHKWWREKDVRRVTITRFTLECFYALMLIFTPLYLFNVLGFGWNIIGVMFAIMLLPFIIFQYPLGWLADKVIGEKELLIIGFLLIILSLLIMPRLGLSIGAWTGILFLSRAGASIAENMTDSYFFKHVTSRNTGLLSIFRLTKPLSIIVATIVGTISINFFSFDKIFIILAIVMFLGLKEGLLIRDTL